MMKNTSLALSHYTPQVHLQNFLYDIDVWSGNKDGKGLEKQ